MGILFFMIWWKTKIINKELFRNKDDFVYIFYQWPLMTCENKYSVASSDVYTKAFKAIFNTMNRTFIWWMDITTSTNYGHLFWRLSFYSIEIVLLIYFDTAITKAKEAQVLLLMKSIFFLYKYSIKRLW